MNGNVILALVFCIVLAIIITIVCIISITDNPNIIATIIVGFIFLTIGVTFYCGYKGNTTHKTLYYVAVDEKTSWAEFNEEFEIIEQKGDLLITEKRSEKKS